MSVLVRDQWGYHYERGRVPWADAVLDQIKDSDHPVKATSDPCAGCGQPIRPGQLYLVDGPYHFGCKL